MAKKAQPAVYYNEDDWKAEYDARQLIEAQAIQDDPARLKKAKVKLGVLLERSKDNYQATEQVVNKLKGTPTKSVVTPKKSSSGKPRGK